MLAAVRVNNLFPLAPSRDFSFPSTVIWPFNQFTASLPIRTSIMIRIKVPCSSANLGPGYDVLGLALSLYLELEINVISGSSSNAPLNCEITCEGLGAEDLKKHPDENLITRVALYVLRCHGSHEFPKLTKVHIINAIPISRGLGSSGTYSSSPCLPPFLLFFGLYNMSYDSTLT